jgi:hypothetical protein
VRPPPGFGVLSPDEVIRPADEPIGNEVETRNTVYTRREEFPTLSDAMKVTTSNNNNSGTIINYSEKTKEPKQRPKPANKPTTQPVASSSRSVVAPNPPQRPLFESTNTKNKINASAFPPLPSANQSTSTSSGSSVLNYKEKVLSGIADSDNSR